jgi:L-methionine (R)-S-oxide reductase
MALTSEVLGEWRSLRTGFWPTDLSNAAALLMERLEGLNWAGFYLLSAGGVLRLGPFQGRVACVEIAPGQGVCGAAAARRETRLVADVGAFPGHIACDPRSRSELAVPLLKGGAVWGVLDLDAPTTGRFREDEARLLEEFCALLLEPWSAPPWPR